MSGFGGFVPINANYDSIPVPAPQPGVVRDVPDAQALANAARGARLDKATEAVSAAP